MWIPFRTEEAAAVTVVQSPIGTELVTVISPIRVSNLKYL